MLLGKAQNASSAARLAESTGSLPEFSPSRGKDGRMALRRRQAAKEAAAIIEKFPEKGIEETKREISEKYKISYLKNSEILEFVSPGNEKARKALLKSPTRTLSGVSPIAIMPFPYPCPGRCIYCPKGKNAPQSYTGFEPATMRAIECGYSAKRQIAARLKQYAAQGHPADKCHLIIMGGTFLCAPKRTCNAFMKEAFDALNGTESATLKEAIDRNENAKHKAVGVTFETRPDFGMQKEADAMLSMGGTQVELGVQALSDRIYRKVGRGHSVADVQKSTEILKDCGFKVGYHMMPGLFSNPAQDVGFFKRLFSDSRFRPDMLKIYPALVIRGTPLYDLWEKGKYAPYSTMQAAKTIAEALRFVPPYVRISRIQRDIPSPLVVAGVKNSNLRQIVESILEKQGRRCRCIRCREIGRAAGGDSLERLNCFELFEKRYSASGGKEIFLSFETEEGGMLAGFLRLRFPKLERRKELENSAVVRELHVYGQEACIGEKSPAKVQHRGLGERLLQEAERIACESGYKKISVLSGPGARGYYRARGYALVGPYMQKRL